MKKIRKFLRPVYELIPLKKQVFMLLRMMGYKGKLTKYLYFKGVFTFKLDGEKVFMYNPGYGSHIENEIFWHGIENAWEKHSIKIWRELCKNANTIVDVGANTGIFTLLALKANKNATVIAFEPLPFVAEKLKKNLSLNNLTCEVYLEALSNKIGTSDVYTESKVNSYTVALDNKNIKDSLDKYTKVTITTTTFATFIEKRKINKIDLIKIDVERHEVMVLEGMGKYLTEMKPDLLIEIQSTEIAEKIEYMVKDLGYLYFNIDEIKGIRKTEHIEKSDYLNYLICSEKTAKSLGLI